MADNASSAINSSRFIKIGVIALYVFCGAMFLRALIYVYIELPAMFPWYAGLAVIFLLLFIFVTLRRSLPTYALHVIYLTQSIIIITLEALPPHLDFLTALFILLCYQMALVLNGKNRWIWCGIFCALILISLIIWFGPVFGIALAMTPIAGNIVILTFAIANREEEHANIVSEVILRELQEKNTQLQVYATQVEQIAAIEERNRLERELHDSVSQTIFSIVLNTRSTQILMERQPDRIRPQLEHLQMLSQEALAEMRSLIAQLRPDNE
jgi:signal transduction histidine kinase